MTSKDILNTKGADMSLSIERILTNLTVCLNQETEAVLQNNRDAASALQEEKIRLMQQYKGLSEKLEKNPDILDQIDPNVRTHLKTISADFQDALKNNLRAIKSAHDAVNRLIDRIMTTARRTLSEDTQKYDAKGALVGAGYNGSMTPTKLNEQL